jgi:twinkle protein
MSVLTQQERATLPDPNYKYITTEDDARDAMNFLAGYPVHAIDTETTSLDPFTAKMPLLQIGVPDHAFVFDLRSDTEHSSVDLSILSPILQEPNILKLLQNAAFDMQMIKVRAGYYLTNVYDTMLAEQILNLGLYVKAGLTNLVERYLGLHMPKEPRGTFSDYHQKYQKYQLVYAANDVVALPMIREMQLPKLKKENLENVARLEFEFLKPLCEMELNGISIDTEKWRSIMKDVEIERSEVKKTIQDILGEVEPQTTLFGQSLINIDSGPQLLKALSRYGIELENSQEATLKKYKGIPVIDALLDYRKANKLISTYSESLLEKIHPVTNRLHTSFKQMVRTGRMSSSKS